MIKLGATGGEIEKTKRRIRHRGFDINIETRKSGKLACRIYRLGIVRIATLTINKNLAHMLVIAGHDAPTWVKDIDVVDRIVLNAIDGKPPT